jgi:hypothetical protein
LLLNLVTYKECKNPVDYGLQHNSSLPLPPP